MSCRIVGLKQHKDAAWIITTRRWEEPQRRRECTYTHITICGKLRFIYVVGRVDGEAFTVLYQTTPGTFSWFFVVWLLARLIWAPLDRSVMATVFPLMRKCHVYKTNARFVPDRIRSLAWIEWVGYGRIFWFLFLITHCDIENKFTMKYCSAASDQPAHLHVLAQQSA